jgi:hypothetical protein
MKMAEKEKIDKRIDPMVKRNKRNMTKVLIERSKFIIPVPES